MTDNNSLLATPMHNYNSVLSLQITLQLLAMMLLMIITINVMER